MKLSEKLPHDAISLVLVFGFSFAVAVPALADGPSTGQSDAGVLPTSLAPPAPLSAPDGVPRLMKPLQGSVEQTGLQGGAPGTFLNGGTQGTVLNGGAESGNWTGYPQQGRTDQWQPGPLQGSAAQTPLQGTAQQTPMALNAMNDPDAGDQELQILWDQWRNTLIQAIQSGTLAKINVHDDVQFVWDPHSQMMVSRYPNGTAAWYSLSVLPDRRIVNIRLTQATRYPSYNQAVLQAINDLQGSNILIYPRGSRRQIVSQEASVSTAPVTQSQYFKFGDVERQRY